MAKVFFPKDGVVNGRVMFKAGETYEMTNELGSVDRWVRRGAVIVEETVTPVEPDMPVIAPDEEVHVFVAPEEEVVKETPKKENKKGKKS